ncbi:hypothetical protein V6N13_107529 [Hibiscus sabdariffa]
MRGLTGGGSGNDVLHGVLGVEHQPGFIVRIGGVKVREGHVDATHPYLPNQGIHVQNHSHINRDGGGGGGGGGVSRLSRHSNGQPDIDEETENDE